MGNFSRDTFDPNKQYVSVRLQQGVPLIDADWNEKEDIRRFERQAFLKWFIGDGVPSNNDGFHIAANASSEAGNNFLIEAGGANNGFDAGRYLVNGLDISITADLLFAAQPLHVSQGRSAQVLALQLEVPTIDMPPPANGTVLVYLDVWEREINSREDSDLVNPLIGVESCVRIKREWVVRVRPGSTVPQPGDSDHLPTHHYAPLATIQRRANDSAIKPEDIKDQRQTGVTLTSLLQRLQFLEQQTLAPKLSPAPNEFWPPLAQPGVSVRIFGNNFTIGTPTVRFGTTNAAIVSVTNTEIVATVPNIAGPRDVKISVRNDFGEVTSTANFRIPQYGALPPLNVSQPFFPAQGRPGEQVKVIFNGTFLNPNTVVIWFDRVAVPIITTNVRGEGGGGIVVTFTDAFVQVPLSLPPGQVKVAVQNNNGIIFGSPSFTVLASAYGSGIAIGGGLL